MTEKHRGPIGTPRTVELWGNRAWRAVPADVEAVCLLVCDGFGGPETVCTWPLEHLAKNAAEWSKEVFEVATGDAESRGQRTGYMLRVVSAVDPAHSFASRNIRVDPDGGQAGIHENTSLSGIVGMLMRHTEALTKQMVVMSERSTAAVSSAMLALAERTAQLERENARLIQERRENEQNEGEQAALVIDAEARKERQTKIMEFAEKAMVAQAMKLASPKPPALKNGAKTNGAKPKG